MIKKKLCTRHFCGIFDEMVHICYQNCNLKALKYKQKSGSNLSNCTFFHEVPLHIALQPLKTFFFWGGSRTDVANVPDLNWIHAKYSDDILFLKWTSKGGLQLNSFSVYW